MPTPVAVNVYDLNEFNEYSYYFGEAVQVGISLTPC